MPLNLPERLKSVTDAEYPRFSPAEMARRRFAIAEMLADA
jgi:hypothetical protein